MGIQEYGNAPGLRVSIQVYRRDRDTGWDDGPECQPDLWIRGLGQDTTGGDTEMETCAGARVRRSGVEPMAMHAHCES